ncbi:MAG: VOC family protein [Rhodospirillales bacterium]|nr:VOC family protein [Rhodospirillales bacterium]
MGHIQGHHHVTLCVGGAQEDYDFHTKLLGLRSVKKTVLFDGKAPFYHLYYGNYDGDPGTLITTFPMAQSGIQGRRGSGQIKVIQCSVPVGALDFWAERLKSFGIDSARTARFGVSRLAFAHPCGIQYELVEAENDSRPSISVDGINKDVGIRGVHGVIVSVRDREGMDDFMDQGFGWRKTGDEGDHTQYEGGDGGSGRVVEVVHEPNLPQGSWTFGAGTVHHCAFGVNSASEQQEVKDYLEGMGYTDVSDSKDRNYFHSVYFRTPGGALFEAAYSVPESFEKDENLAALGTEFQLPPWLEDQRDELLSKLEPIEF